MKAYFFSKNNIYNIYINLHILLIYLKLYVLKYIITMLIVYLPNHKLLFYAKKNMNINITQTI